MQQVIRTIIIDDEFQSRNILTKLVEEIAPDFELCGSASGLEDGLEMVTRFKPDLLLLDIQLQGCTGFEFLQQCKDIRFDIIFVSAYDHYALKAFRLSAIDYLLKPVIPGELQDALQKARTRFQLKNNNSQMRIDLLNKRLAQPESLNKSITIPIPDGFTVVAFDDIIYCQASGNYTHFFLQGGKKIISAYTLKHYDEMLSEHGFFRAHKSSLLNLKHVKEYHKGEGGVVIMSNNDQIELSRNHKDAFLSIFRR